MTNEKLVQSEDMYEDMHEDFYEEMYEDHVCPRCSSLLQRDYALAESGSFELVWLCYYCGHME